MISEKINLNVSQFSTLLLSISIIIWTISIYFSKLDIGYYGLISGLNPLFFVSISILTISFFITIKKNITNTKLLFLHITFLTVFISLIPILIEGTPRFPYNFHTSRSIDYILQYGVSNSTAIQYQSWPGIFYFGSMFSSITNIDPVKLILYGSMIFFYINILLSYLIFSTFLNKRETWTALLLSSVLFFSSPIYFVPGVLGTLMITFAIITFLRFELIQFRSSMSTRIIFIIFCAAAVVSHFLSSAYLFMVLIFFSILLLIYKRDSNSKYVLVFVMLAAFQIYVAGSYSLSTIGASINTAFHLESLVTQTNQMGFSGSQAHTTAVMIRIFSGLILISLAGLGFFYEFFIKRKRKLKDLLVPTWIAANTSMVLVTSYSGEIINRTFALNTNLFNILASKAINNKYLSIILLVILLISPPLSIINAYGNEAVDYVAPTEINGANFLFDHLYLGSYPNGNDGSYVRALSDRTLLIRYSNSIYFYNYEANLTSWDNAFPENERRFFKNFYVVVNDRDIEQSNFLQGQVNIEKIKSIETVQDYGKIYDNNGYYLFILER